MAFMCVRCFTKGTLATSKFIKQNINFEGECIVWIDGVENFKSPYIGVTKAGTQRVVYASKNLVWATSLIPIIKTEQKG
jgi:hypothetical protein